MNRNWKRRFIGLAHHVGSWSKDPSTKVGVVIVDTKRRIISTGYNGFPRGVSDNPSFYADKSTKYPRVVHAEANAILTAKCDLEGMSIFVDPYPPCCECAKLIIQSGIKFVYYVDPGDKITKSQLNYKVGQEMLMEAGVKIIVMYESRRKDKSAGES